jgi:hypothetical protein
VKTKHCLSFCGAVFLLSPLAMADTITVGTPNSYGSGLSPTFGTLVNFDSLTPLSTVSSTAFLAEGVLSITNNPGSNPLIALPYSQQSPPIEIGTDGSDNYAGDITITFVNTQSEVGIGIGEDGSTQTTLTAYGATGNVLGNFIETVPSSTFNAYYVISDPSNAIKSLEINASQNLGIDDLQFTSVPEPSSIALAAFGLIFVAASRRRKVN